MNKPSRGEILKLAADCGAFIDVLYAGRHDNTVFTSGELERFALAMYAAGAEAMRERAAKDWDGCLYNTIGEDIDIGDAIRALPITTSTEGE